jgi:membrane protein implicated in regulation of membrane protease activity
MKYQYRKRLALSWAAFLLLVVALVFSAVSVWVSSVVTFFGVVCGSLAGFSEWKRISQRIDRQNRLVVFAEDAIWVALLLPLFLLSQAPAVAGRLAFHVYKLPRIAYGVMLFFLALSTAYTAVIYWRLRRHELANGPLLLKEHYARSVIGTIGMLGQEGTVVAACTPYGRVKVGAELWNARSVDVRIEVGEQVRVTDVEGLTLIVERQL